MDREPMTARGAQLLRAELARLKTEERPAITQAIAQAREHGDLRENFEYKAARDQQGFVEGRIKEIEAKLATAQVIAITAADAGGRVVFGSTVQLADADSGEQLRYRIVGEDEADIGAGLLSVRSPIARALVGKSRGEAVEVETPGGARVFDIQGIEYESDAAPDAD